MEYVYLQGSEDVQRASGSIRASAEMMQSASNNLAQSLYDNQVFLNDWLDRLENILKENK